MSLRQKSTIRRGWLALAGAFAIGLAAPAAAQDTTSSWDANAARVTRPTLESLLERYQRAAESSAYSPVLRAEARDQADLIRQRLVQGDFRVGDRVYILVEDYAELTDTLSVGTDQTIALPGVGELELAGVLRSELQAQVTEAVSRTIREPRIRTSSLVRVSVDGAVGAPGYYLLEADVPLSDVLMVAGGYTRDAKLDEARIERAGETIVTADRFGDALRAGATVDELGLRDGDRLYVPAERTGMLTTARELMFIIPSLIGLLALLG